MGIKKVLGTIGKAAIWPFAALMRAILSPQGHELLSQAADLALKTPLGALVKSVVEEIENVKSGDTGLQKHTDAFVKIVEQATRLEVAYTKWAINILIELAVGLAKKRLGVLGT